MLDMFKDFLKDKEAESMYITGQAGTGKTTGLKELIDFCMSKGIEYQVCAYTHDACKVLASKLPQGANISTLHSFLEKRPTINVEARKVSKVESNSEAGRKLGEIDILFIDEFSMIGERDYQDLNNIQYMTEDPFETSEYPNMKILWIGDPHQLPPVKDQPAVIPSKPYWHELTKIWRQAEDNPLIIPLTQLVGFIKGEKPERLVESEKFIRGDSELLTTYANCCKDKILLAYTNQRVQDLNFAIQGREEPEEGDQVFSPSTRQTYTFNGIVPKEFITSVIQFNGNLNLGSKYKTLEYLLSSNLCEFYELETQEGKTAVYPIIFGTKNYNNAKDEYAEAAVKVNKAIETELGVDKAAEWAKFNRNHPLARERAQAWRKYLAIKSNIFSLDFTHAKTVHKAQGTTINTVFLDAIDLEKCMHRDFNLYCKLYYVALSRASNMVITN